MIVTDGLALLLGHASLSPRWDIPKGLAEPGEPPLLAACRELLEETGLRAPAEALLPLGRHVYLPNKELVLFAWRRADLPDPAKLRCTSMIDRPGRKPMPELDRFGVFTLAQALPLLGRNMARVIDAVWPLATADAPG